jgi:hypothetical protein
VILLDLAFPLRLGLDYLLNLRLLLLPALAVALYAEGTETVQSDAIVDQYCAATRDQARLLDGASMDMEIEAALPKLKKQGRLHGLRRIADLGRITYQALRFDGDSVVKKYVIEKYLSAEMEAQGSSAASIALTPENYKFKYKGQTEMDDAKVYMFEVTPRKKRAGLFKGTLWIDAVTYLRVQDAGVMVKSPSVFLKRVSFVRKYVIYNGVSVPRLVQSLVETRVAGKAELTIGYSNISVPAAARVALSEEAVQ